MLGKIYVAALLICFATVTTAQEMTPREQQVIKLYTPLYKLLQANNIKSEVAVVPNASPNDSPMSMTFKPATQTCMLLIQVRKNKVLPELLRFVKDEDEDAVIQAILAHETAHCIQSITKDTAVGIEHETNADKFAIYFTAKFNPTKLEAVTKFFHALRTRIQSSTDSVHDTAAALEAIKLPDVLEEGLMGLYGQATL